MRIINPGSNYFSENKSFNGKKITEKIKEEKTETAFLLERKRTFPIKLPHPRKKETISGFIIRTRILKKSDSLEWIFKNA